MCADNIVFAVFPLLLQQYVQITCVCMTMNGDANQPTNKNHLNPKLSGNANEIGREQRKKTMRFQNNNSYSKYLLVCLFVCIHLIRHRRMDDTGHSKAF